MSAHSPATIPVTTLCELAMRWWGDRLDPDWPRLPDSQHTHSDEDKVNWGKNAKERVPVHA